MILILIALVYLNALLVVIFDVEIYSYGFCLNIGILSLDDYPRTGGDTFEGFFL